MPGDRVVARGATGQKHLRIAPGQTHAAHQATLDLVMPEPRTLESQMHMPLFGEQVIALHAEGRRDFGPGPNAGDSRASPYKDALIDQIRIGAQDETDLLALLHTLTDDSVPTRPKFAPP